MTTVTKTVVGALFLALAAILPFAAQAGNSAESTNSSQQPLPICDASTLHDVETYSAG